MIKRQSYWHQIIIFNLAAIGLLLILLMQTSLAAKPLAALPADQLDWHDYGADRPTQALCYGYYQRPPYLLKPPTEHDAVKVQSDQASYTANGGTRLTGNVILRRRKDQLQSTSAELNADHSQVTLPNPMIYRLDEALIRGNQATIALNTDAASIHDAHYVFYHGHTRGDAQLIQRLLDGRFQLDEASYTSCEPGNNSWLLVSHNIQLDRQRGIGTAKGTWLNIGDVPVFYVPWLRFPIDKRRLTGLLFPNIGLGGKKGIDYAQPIYFNLAPNYDALLEPRFMTGRGFMLSGQFRYLLAKSRGQIEGSFLPHDNVHGNAAHHGNNRWLFNFDHQGYINSAANYRLKYGAASDGDFFEDFGNNFAQQNIDHLSRLAEINYQGKVWHLTARLRGYQIMDYPLKADDKPYSELPALLANAHWSLPYNFYFNWASSASYFYRDTDFNQVTNPTKTSTGARLILSPTVGWHINRSWGYLDSQLQYFFNQYQLDWRDLKSNTTQYWRDDPHLAVPVFSVDSGLFFDRNFKLAGSSWRQTFEPRLFYAYVPYHDQDQIPQFDTNMQASSFEQLWSPFRFYGDDRIGDVNKIAYGFTSRFIDSSSGLERFNISIGQAHYFSNRHVTDNDPNKFGPNADPAFAYDLRRHYSPAISQLRWQVNQDWSANYAIYYNTEHRRTEKNEIYASYQPISGSVVNLGYRWQRKSFDPAGDISDRLGYNRDEYDISFAWQATQAFSVIGRYLYDQTNQRPLEKLAGIQFNSCCYAIELAWREYVDNNGTLNTIQDDRNRQAIFLRFILKGLGGLGSNPDSYLEQAIPGYRRVNY